MGGWVSRGYLEVESSFKDYEKLANSVDSFYFLLCTYEYFSINITEESLSVIERSHSLLGLNAYDGFLDERNCQYPCYKRRKRGDSCQLQMKLDEMRFEKKKKCLIFSTKVIDWNFNFVRNKGFFS